MATPTAPERNPRGQGDLLRDRLVDAALAMIDEGTDPAQLSIRAVTKRAGVSPTAFYLHFENRDELLVAMIDRCFTEFRDAVRAAADEAGNPADRLDRAGLAYADFAHRHPARYALNFVFMKQAEGDAPPKPTAADDSFNDLVRWCWTTCPRTTRAATTSSSWPAESGRACTATSASARPAPGMGWPAAEEFVPGLSLAWLGPPAH